MKKKILSLGLATIVLASTVACSDQTESVDKEENNMKITEETKENDNKLQAEEQEVDSKYEIHQGNVSELSQEDGSVYVTVDAEYQEDGYETIKFNISDETYVLDDKIQDFIDTKELKEGMIVEVFYEKDSPMTRSIPPMTNAKAIIVREESQENELGIKIDTFDKDFTSSDNFLQLKITEDTIIVDKEGKKLTQEDIVDKESIVFFGPAMTMSIPGQSQAVKVIVL